MRLVDEVARDDDDIRVGLLDLAYQRGRTHAEKLVVKIRYLHYLKVLFESQVHFVFCRDEMVVMVKAEDAYDDLEHHQYRNDIELGFSGLVMKYPHAEERTDGTAYPCPEEQRSFGDSALVLLRVRLVEAVEDERGNINC